MVEIEQDKISFCTELNVREYISIIHNWGKIPPFGYIWWEHITSFGLFFLEQMVMEEDEEKFLELKKTITWRDWHKFIPLLKKFFITNAEYREIVNNVSFIKRRPSFGPSEDPVFHVYLLFRQQQATMTLNDIMDLDYKTFLKFYFYNLGEAIVDSIADRKKQQNHMTG